MLITRLSLVLLELLQHNQSEKNSSEGNQINALNHILKIANDEQTIETIVYFGQRDLIEPYISPLMSGTPKVIIANPYGQPNLHFEQYFNNKIFFLAFGTLESSMSWQYLYDIFTSMQSHVRGIFIASTRKGLQEHFDWCWRNGFLNIIAIIPVNNQSQQYKLYTYTPFPILRVIELQQNDSTSFFQNKLDNLRGYKIRTALYNDPPRAFSLSSPLNDNETIYSGYAARMYLDFLKYHNASWEIIEKHKTNSNNILSVIEQLNQGIADLSMNPYLPYPGTRNSYPMHMTPWCILVPAKGVLDGYVYFLRPFHLEVWLLNVAMLLYLSCIKSFNEFIDSKIQLTKQRNLHIDLGHSFIEMLRLMLYLPTPQTYQNFRWHYAWNYGIVAIFGFMISNLYLALLTSFLSKIIFEKQVDTLNDMVLQNISLHAIEHEIPIILRNRGLPKGFADLLIPRNATEMTRDLLALRTGQAYIARLDILNFVLIQQNNLLQPKFHIAEECITTVPIGFLMPSHSQFKIELDVFTLQAAAAGLLFRWYQNTITDAFLAGIFKEQVQKTKTTIALSIEHFQFAFMILFFGYISAVSMFLIEQFARLSLQVSVKCRNRR